jgi:hypothetical protein
MLSVVEDWDLSSFKDMLSHKTNYRLIPINREAHRPHKIEANGQRRADAQDQKKSVCAKAGKDPPRFTDRIFKLLLDVRAP